MIVKAQSYYKLLRYTRYGNLKFLQLLFYTPTTSKKVYCAAVKTIKSTIFAKSHLVASVFLLFSFFCSIFAVE